jgi:hypothetical protein
MPQWCCCARLMAASGLAPAGSPHVQQWASNKHVTALEDRWLSKCDLQAQRRRQSRSMVAVVLDGATNAAPRPTPHYVVHLALSSYVSSYLQCRDQVCCLEQGQLADLVHNCRNLGVRGRRCGIRLPSPLYPLLCSSNGRADAHRRAGGADAAPQGARCGGGHVVRCRIGGRWYGWQSSCRTFLRFCGRQCTICGLAPWQESAGA